MCGLIPAHAGKTSRLIRIGELPTAHPRACGENKDELDSMSEGEGSSPRMRGKLPTNLDRANDARLIPAHAGKTTPISTKALPSAAHPRACGENPLAAARPILAPWLIPAHAGKTPLPLAPNDLVGAHPRACGENRPVSTGPSAAAGSSPRMRGKLFGSSTGLLCGGLIPAHAGKTIRLLKQPG